LRPEKPYPTGYKIVPKDDWVKAVSSHKVSIEVLIRGYGTVEEDWGYLNRTVDAHIIYFVIKGGIRALFYNTGSSQTAREEVTIGPGELFWVAPQVRHDFSLLVKGTPLTLFYMRLAARLDSGEPCRTERDFFHLRQVTHLLPWFEQFFTELQENDRYHQECLRGYLVLFFSRIFRHYYSQSGQPDAQPQLNPKQREAIQNFLLTHLKNRVTPQDLAGVVNLSPDYFARQFKQTYGVIPRTWLVQEKMRLASVELVTTRKSITRVAAELGYSDLYLFSRQFKNVCGCSPREFRLRHN